MWSQGFHLPHCSCSLLFRCANTFEVLVKQKNSTGSCIKPEHYYSSSPLVKDLEAWVFQNLLQNELLYGLQQYNEGWRLGQRPILG